MENGLVEQALDFVRALMLHHMLDKQPRPAPVSFRVAVLVIAPSDIQAGVIPPVRRRQAAPTEKVQKTGAILSANWSNCNHV